VWIPASLVTIETRGRAIQEPSPDSGIDDVHYPMGTAPLASVFD
jgi:hypothetical protein